MNDFEILSPFINTNYIWISASILEGNKEKKKIKQPSPYQNDFEYPLIFLFDIYLYLRKDDKSSLARCVKRYANVRSLKFFLD